MQTFKTANSRLNRTDMSNLEFGKVFSDHMLICKYKSGKWQDPLIKEYGPIDMNPGTQVLHYGQSVFEGMKAFKNKDGDLLIFRKEDSLNRLNQSACRLSIPELPREIFMKGLDSLLQLDAAWCHAKEGYSLYIRPFIFASGECIKASPSEEYTFIIITSPTTLYYHGDIHMLVEQEYSRAARGGVGFTKAAGNYAASFYPTRIAKEKGFTQLIWTDSIEHKDIEEAGTMNIWFRIQDRLVTPQISDTILPGITRDSIINLAKDIGIDVEERKISIQEILDSYNSGYLKEVFGTGTAVVVSDISSITVGETRLILNPINDSYSRLLRESLSDIQKGVVYDKHGWTSRIDKYIS